MVLQVFQNKYSILYVEGGNKIVAKELINYQNKMNYHYPSKTVYFNYIGEYDNIDEIIKNFQGLFIDGIKNKAYKSFIKEKSLINIMKDYWENFFKN
jgi:hypothetical protein